MTLQRERFGSESAARKASVSVHSRSRSPRATMVSKLALIMCLPALTGWAETSLVTSTNVPASARPLSAQEQARALDEARRAEQIRTTCIEGRRFISGRVVQVTPDGLVVDSGYSRLLSAPFNHSWVVRGTALVDRDASAVEEKRPDALCVGLVFLSNIPKRPAVKNYDYVVIHGYPAGEYCYVPVPGVQKIIRRFSASLERAVQINVERERK
jgi:hypothetical protein